MRIPGRPAKRPGSALSSPKKLTQEYLVIWHLKQK